MNRERAKELLPIIQAFAEGKEIQWKINADSEWFETLPDSTLSFPDKFEYRIKPEPREFWLNAPISEDKKFGFDDYEDAKRMADAYGDIKPIKVREVLDD